MYSEQRKFCTFCTTHQQITRNSRHLQTKHKISYTFLAHFAHILLHVFYMYACIMHHSRLALKMISNFTMLTVCCVKMYVFFIPNCTIISGPNALINPNNTPKCCSYARLQPVYCQLIVLTSNILSLAKSLIGIGTVMLTPCLSFPIFRRPPAFLVGY